LEPHRNSYTTAAGTERSAQAFLAAEAGVERAIAELSADSNWDDDMGADAPGVTAAAWMPKYTNIPLTNGARLSIWLREVSGADPKTNMSIRAIGEARGAARTIEYIVESQDSTDIVLYSINTLSTCAISGGGSLQFHGSAYIEQDVCIKGGSQAGYFNDRYVQSSDAPDYFNHFYVSGDLDTSTATLQSGRLASRIGGCMCRGISSAQVTRSIS
jgi:hypothetical protein